MDKVMAIIAIVIGGIAIAGLACLALAFPFMWLWNYSVVSALSCANPIEYFHALGLMFFISAFVVGTGSKSKKGE
jgi:hypothetical protein